MAEWGDYLGIPDEDDDPPFGQVAMQRMAKIAQIVDDPDAVERLRLALVPLGRDYRRIISIVPSELERAPSHESQAERLEWLDTHILFPLKSLIAALGDERRHMLSMWPQELRPAVTPDWNALQEQLNILLNLVQNVTLNVMFYRDTGISVASAVRYSIVVSAMNILSDALPNLKPSRGTYDRVTKSFNGIYPDLLRAIYKEITGEDERLDRVIKELLDELRDPNSFLSGKPFQLGEYLSAVVERLPPSEPQ